jgi:hypothetical protein
VQQRDNAGEGKFLFYFFLFCAGGGLAALTPQGRQDFFFPRVFLCFCFYLFILLGCGPALLFSRHFFLSPPFPFGFAGRMMAYLIEDRHATVVSYVDFLCHIHSQIQAKLV